jgi:hypothetical protein
VHINKWSLAREHCKELILSEQHGMLFRFLKPCNFTIRLLSLQYCAFACLLKNVFKQTQKTKSTLRGIADGWLCGKNSEFFIALCASLPGTIAQGFVIYSLTLFPFSSTQLLLSKASQPPHFKSFPENEFQQSLLSLQLYFQIKMLYWVRSTFQ